MDGGHSFPGPMSRIDVRFVPGRHFGLNRGVACMDLFRSPVTQVTYCYGFVSVVVRRPSCVNIFSSDTTGPIFIASLGEVDQKL